MRSVSLFAFFLTFMVAMAIPGANALAASHTVCNDGNTELFVAVAHQKLGSWGGTSDATARGWWTIRPNGCEVVWSGNAMNMYDFYVGFAHAGSNMKSGVGVYKIDRQNSLDMPYEYFCVNLDEHFTYRKLSFKALTEGCPSDATLMLFSYRVKMRGSREFVLSVTPDVNKPVLPFGSRDEIAVASMEQGARNLAESARDLEEALAEITGGEAEPSAGSAAAAPISGQLECSELKTALSYSKSYFEDIIDSNSKTGGNYLIFDTEFKYSGFENSCSVNRVLKDGAIQSGYLGCYLEGPQSASLLQSRHEAIGSAIQKCIGIAPSIDNDTDSSFLKRFRLDGDRHFINLVSHKSTRKTDIAIYIYPGR